MERIKLSAVLAEINHYERDGKPFTFSLDYVKANGQRGRKERCRKSGTKSAGAAQVTTSKFRYRVKERGVLMLVDDTNDQAFSVAIRRLTHFNSIRIQH